MHKLILRIGVIVIILIVLIGLFWYTSISLNYFSERFNAHNRRVNIAFNPYPDSELIYERAIQSAKVSTKIVVYWTNASIKEVRLHNFLNPDRLLIHQENTTYYLSDEMSPGDFQLMTTTWSFEICSYSLDLTKLDLYLFPASSKTFEALEPLYFGCVPNIALNSLNIPIRQEGTYIVLGYEAPVVIGTPSG